MIDAFSKYATILLLTFSYGLFAQSSVTIVDAISGNPIHAKVEFICLSGIYKGEKKQVNTTFSGVANNPFFSDTTEVIISSTFYLLQTIALQPNESRMVWLEPEVFHLDEIVITLQPIPKHKDEIVYEVQTISNHSLTAKGATNLKEAFATELNFRTNNGHVNETALMLNGLSGNHIKVMIDGVPVIGRLNGNVDLSQINLNDVSKVEIIEGPVSVAYGSNALGGVVNIITNKTQENKLSSTVNTYYETIGQYNVSVATGIKKGENLYKLSVGRNFFQGFTNLETLREVVWKPREQYMGTFSLNRKIKKGDLSYAFEGFSELMTSRGEPSAPYYITAFDSYFKTNRISNRVLLNKRLGENKQVNIICSHAYYKRKRNIYYVDLTTVEKTPTADSDQDTTMFNTLMFRGVYSQKKDKWEYGLGSDFNQDFISANRISSGSQQIGDYAFFSTVTYKPVKSLLIQPGVRYAYNTKYLAPIVPSINMLYKKKHVDVRASYARGFRAPSLKELYLEFHLNSSINLWGNEDLKAESSEHYNISVAVHDTIQKHYIEFSPSFFRTKINNLIGLVQISDIDWKYENFNNYTTQGVTLKSEYHYNNICVKAGYTYFGYINSMFNTEGFRNKYNYSDNVNGTFNYRLDSLGLSINLMYKYTGAINSFYLNDEGEVTKSFIDAFNTFDVSVSKKVLKKKGGVTLGVKNIFDVNSVAMNGDVYGVSNSSDAKSLSVLWGRTYFVSFKLSL